MNFKLLLMTLTMMGTLSTAHAQSAQDSQAETGDMRRYMGVAGETAEEAIMELVQVCLTSPLIETEIVTFEGIGDLKFGPQESSNEIYASADCIYRPTQ